MADRADGADRGAARLSGGGRGPLHIVSLSGGKDSTATLALALETQPHDRIEGVFADTGIEHELTYETVDRIAEWSGVPIRRVRRGFAEQLRAKRERIPESWSAEGVSAGQIDRAVAILQPTGVPFLDLCLWKGRFPSTRARFCTEHLKRIPLRIHHDEACAREGWVWSWIGVRHDESPARAHLAEWEEAGGGLGIYRPILRWKAEDCFEAMAAAGAPVNPLYLQGMKRVGCMPCILAGKGEIAEMARRWPEHVERVREYERLVGEASKRGRTTFFHKFDHSAGGETVEEIYERERIDSIVDWARTSRGGRIYDLWKGRPAAADDGVLCASAYGLCE